MNQTISSSATEIHNNATATPVLPCCVLLYLESRRCRYRSIIFACFYLYVSVVKLIDYSDIDKMMDINNEKC
jgi:hypothetical protein